MATCRTCCHFIGGGDWSLCCDLKHDLCYRQTPACDQYERRYWVYYMLMRPYGPGTAPHGVVDWAELDGVTIVPGINHAAWAVLAYQRQLTAREISDYELAEVDV